MDHGSVSLPTHTGRGSGGQRLRLRRGEQSGKAIKKHLPGGGGLNKVSVCAAWLRQVGARSPPVRRQSSRHPTRSALCCQRVASSGPHSQALGAAATRGPRRCSGCGLPAPCRRDPAGGLALRWLARMCGAPEPPRFLTLVCPPRQGLERVQARWQRACLLQVGCLSELVSALWF